MKKVMAWVKSNVLIVVFSAIIILSMPLAFFGASWWGGKITTERKDAASKRLTDVQNLKYTYSLAPIMPGGVALEEKRVANNEVSAAYADWRAKRQAASQQVVKSAVDFNRGAGPEAAKTGRTAHAPIIDGLFPKPAAGVSVPEMTNRFVAALVNTQNRPSVYATMLRDVINAGDPVDPVALGKNLDGERSSRMAKLGTDGTSGKLAPADQEAMDQALLNLRRNTLLSRASEISVYASLDSLPIAGRGQTEGSTIPAEIPVQPPSVSLAFQWQMDYWLIHDLLIAVRTANGGGRGSVTDSVVKRIDKITILDPFASGSVASSDPSGAADPMAAPAAATTVDQLTGLVPLDAMRSVTGRKSSMQNPLYDVRTVKLNLVLSAPRMKEFFNALAKTNFMTVTGLSLNEVDVRGELDRGYYFGPESVVQATITIETVWLRSWTQDLFPSGVKRRLGLPLAEGEKPDDSDMAGGSGNSGSPDSFGDSSRSRDVPQPMTPKGNGR